MSNLLNTMKTDNNFTYTENGSVTHESTLNHVLDMFALGGSYRTRTDKEIEELFGDAYRENPVLALKCLFYLRDCRGGQGERRFFRVAYKWLVRNDEATATANIKLIPEMGRWDDLIDIAYANSNTSFAFEAIKNIDNQLLLDDDCKTPSLLGKWMPSENASAKETKLKAKWMKSKLGYNSKVYRKMLSSLRQKINIVERLMSENRFDEIEFDKIPSIAGMKYRNAFAVREITAARYKTFMKDKNTKVNADTLNPVDIADKIIYHRNYRIDEAERAALCKYWDNLKDYYNGREENAIAIVDTSGSMYGQPLAAAVGMGAYVAEKSHGPFANHFITFSSEPKLVEFNGDDIVDKIQRCINADWGMSTNIAAAMDLILDSAVAHKLPQSDLPARLYIFSDMQFDYCVELENDKNDRWGYVHHNTAEYETLFEKIEKKWASAGYEMPMITFWNLQARTNTIPAIGNKFNYISGFSMSQMEAIMAGKTAVDMMLEVLNKERYNDVIVML